MDLALARVWPLLLLLLPILIRRRQAAVYLHPQLSILEDLSDHQSVHRWLRYLRAAIYLLLVLACCQPRFPDAKTRIPTRGIALIFIIDTSPSMEAKTFPWTPTEMISRNEAARRMLKLFVQGGTTPNGMRFSGRATERGIDAIGLVTFSILPQTLCPPTLNHSLLLQLLDNQKQSNVLETGTNIGDALGEGLLRLQATDFPRKVIILMTDGEHNFTLDDPERKPLKPRQAAQIGANLGIPIHVVDVGGEPGLDATQDQIQQRRDGQTVNRDISRLTGGKSFSADDGTSLSNVYAEINQLEQKSIDSLSYRRYYEVYPILIALAALGFVALLLLQRTIWRIVPE
jgi:Ca-activated chloride channel homolog